MPESVPRAALRVALAAATLASAAALVVGALVTLLALWPGTDMHDARVFFRLGPRGIIGGVAGLLLARWARRALLGSNDERCAACGTGTLRVHDWVRATCVDESGQRYPDSWTYYECEGCGARTKEYLDGRVETPSDEEWDSPR